MASPTTVLLLSFIAGVFAISATARPCKTIFFITSSNSFYPATNHHLRNPNTNPPRFTFFITEIHRTTSFSRHIFPAVSKPSSFHDRTMDVVSIAGALLFGAGCGALTAATMYLFWSLFSNRRLDFASDSDEDEFYEEEDDVSPKKNGYAAVPTTGAKEVPPSADEVDAMK